MQKQVLHNQSLLDIAIQENGAVASVFELIIENAMSITDELIPGQNIEVSVSNLLDQELVDYFDTKKILLASGFNGSEHEDILPQLGIGSMRIGTTFIVG